MMSHLASAENYLDNDVAYLLGMVLMRGSFHVENDIRRLVIQFPYKLTQAKSIPGSSLSFNRENELRLSLDNIRNTIVELLSADINIVRSRNEVNLVAIFTRNSMDWRNMRALFEEKSSYHEFSVPKVIFDAPADIKKDFLRGVVDVASNPSHGDIGPDKRQRVVIEFQHSNWLAPIQVCRLLQEGLSVNVSHILWGHPNLRASTKTDDLTSWQKEHRLRLMPEDFTGIGYGKFEYKQKILEELIEWNRNKSLDTATRSCNPQIKKPRRVHQKHKGEKSSKLPKQVRKHFNASFQICKALGCAQGGTCGQEDDTCE